MAELNNTIVRGKLRVTSEAEAQTIYENGTSLANKYLQLSGGTLNGSLQIFSTGGNWDEGIRIHPASNNWSGIIFCDSSNTGGTGTSTNTWSIHNNEGVFGAYKNGSNISSATHGFCHNGSNWYFKGGSLYVNDTAVSLNGHTHSYLPLSGGTLTGTLNSRTILPTANNGYDLGSSSKMFSQIYSNYIRSNYVQALGSSLGVYAGNDTIGLYIDAANYNHRVVRFESDGGLPIGEMGSYTNGKEGNSDRVDYLRVGTAYSSHYGADGYSEIQLSCVGTGEGDTMDYVCIRPQGTSAGGIVYLPNVSGWNTVFLATTDQIPSVLPAQYVTSPPSSNNYTGIKFVLLDSSVYPASSVTKRDGYIYMWY